MKEAVNNHPHHNTKKVVKRGGEKKNIKQNNGPQKNWDLEIPQSNFLASVSIYIVLWGEEDRKEGR